MEEKLKIKLSIADRVYPLTVELSQEEGLRSASKKIDAMIKQFEENYAVRDKQDVLAMCALQFASQVEQKQVSNAIDGSETLERLKKINDVVFTYHPNGKIRAIIPIVNGEIHKYCYILDQNEQLQNIIEH